MKNSSKSSKVLASLLTLAVIGLIIGAGPASALSLQLDGLSEDPYVLGEDVSFTASIDIQSNEVVNLKKVDLKLNGNVVCTFDIKGNPISLCPGIDVTLLSDTSTYGYGYGYDTFHGNGTDTGEYYGYGYYGYGYGYSGNGITGKLLYNVTIHTDDAGLLAGHYELQFSAINGDGNSFNSEVDEFDLIQGTFNPNVDLYIKQPYPKGPNYVFVCNATNFVATEYDWFYGDGEKLINITNGDTYHTYKANGKYGVTCIARNGNVSAAGMIEVDVTGADEEPNVDLYIKNPYPKGPHYVFVCNATNFEAATYDWFYGDGEKLLNITNGDTYHTYKSAGNKTVTCTAYSADGQTQASDSLMIKVGPKVSNAEPK